MYRDLKDYNPIFYQKKKAKQTINSDTITEKEVTHRQIQGFLWDMLCIRIERFSLL